MLPMWKDGFVSVSPCCDSLGDRTRTVARLKSIPAQSDKRLHGESQPKDQKFEDESFRLRPLRPHHSSSLSCIRTRVKAGGKDLS
jgi:hypothetical protein